MAVGQAALTRLYTVTAGANWIEKSGWLGPSPPCSWAGVSCNTDDEVIAIGLFANALTGTIPPQLSQLSALQHLNLAASSLLSGTVPSDLARLSHLSFFDLRTTSISGTVPSGLSVAEQLYFHQTSISGTLPPSLTRSSTLRTLDFEYTSLSGTLPPLAPLKALERLALSQSALSGTVPSAIASLSSLSASVRAACASCNSPRIGNLRPLLNGEILKHLPNCDFLIG